MTPSPSPKLPACIFYATDVALLIAAGFVATQAPRPLPNASIFAIVACVIAGAFIATIPRLVQYEREKNAALDERQRALESLAQTVASSAEQISVAASGLHAIAELSHKNLRQAEQLPHKLQDKIAEFQAQIANAEDTEKEELEQELIALRSSESERLESISDRIAKSAAELARVEASLQKQLTAHHALRESPPPAAEKSFTPNGADSLPSAVPPETIADDAAHPPKRLRKARREEAPPESFPGAAIAATNPSFPLEEPPPVKLQEITPVAPDSQSPYADRLIGQSKSTDAPLSPAPEAAAPASGDKPARKRLGKKPAEVTADNLFGIEVTTTATSVSTAPIPSPAAISEFSQVSPDEAAPAAAIAADGATRLLVTAYIGIGNRLYIRGDGPGLSWEKGLPLQFVSIGKWRWETADATTAVKFKLYKNDEHECTSLGLHTLAPGHQQEISAVF